MFGRVYSPVKMLALKARYGKHLEIKRIRQVIRLDTQIHVDKDAFLSIGSIDVGTNVHLLCDHGVMSIGNGVVFNRNCIVVCWRKISIGNNCLFGPNVCIYDHDHVFDTDGVHPYELACAEIIIEDGCWIGAGAIILRGTHIGKNSVIGAGSVVKGNVPPNSLVVSDRGNKIIPLSFFKNKPEDIEFIK